MKSYAIGLALTMLLPLGAAEWVEHPVDRYGQSVKENWPGKITSDEQLREIAAAEWPSLKGQEALDLQEYDQYGGKRENLGLKATGRFRLEKLQGRWWFITPEGNRYFMQGCDSVGWRGNATPLYEKDTTDIRSVFTDLPNKEEFPEAYSKKGFVNFLMANLRRVYGDKIDERLTEMTVQRLRMWGFNATSKWSGMGLPGMPFISDFRLSGVRTFGRRWIDFYDDGFEAQLDASVAKACAKCRELPFMIAYAVENENGWEHGMRFEALLQLDGSWAAKRALMAFLAKRHEDVGALFGQAGATQEALAANTKLDLKAIPTGDLKAFVLASSERYHRMLLAAFRKHDPSHLVMGAAHCAMQSREWIEGACKYMDFIGVNTYDIYARWNRGLNDLYVKYDKPFTLLEYSFVTAGRGYRPYNPNITVETEEQRGLAYRYFVERETARPYCVGTGYFRMWDQPVNRRNFDDGENFAFGLISQQGVPYQAMLKHVPVTNRRQFALHDGKLEPVTDINPLSLLALGAAFKVLTGAYMPDTLTANFAVDSQNGATFFGVANRLKSVTTELKDGDLSAVGVIDLQKVPQLSIPVYVIKQKTPVPPEACFALEESADLKDFAVTEAVFEEVADNGKVVQYQMKPKVLKAASRYVRVNFKVYTGMPRWAKQIGEIKTTDN